MITARVGGGGVDGSATSGSQPPHPAPTPASVVVVRFGGVAGVAGGGVGAEHVDHVHQRVAASYARLGQAPRAVPLRRGNGDDDPTPDRHADQGLLSPRGEYVPAAKANQLGRAALPAAREDRPVAPRPGEVLHDERLAGGDRRTTAADRQGGATFGRWGALGDVDDRRVR